MELMDIYDENRMRTGRTFERGAKLAPGEYCYVVHVYIFNSEGKLLIQQRQSFKSGWANMWDTSAAGAVSAGETTAQAAERETLEELGYELKLDDTRPHMTISFDYGFSDAFIVERDLDIEGLKLQYEEVQAVKWASLDEIKELIITGEFVPLKSGLIDLAFASRKHRGTLNTLEEA